MLSKLALPRIRQRPAGGWLMTTTEHLHILARLPSNTRSGILTDRPTDRLTERLFLHQQFF